MEILRGFTYEARKSITGFDERVKQGEAEREFASAAASSGASDEGIREVVKRSKLMDIKDMTIATCAGCGSLACGGLVVGTIAVISALSH